MRGYDQATNLILDECHERVFSSKVCPAHMLPSLQLSLFEEISGNIGLLLQAGVEQIVLGGLHVVRGDNMCARSPHLLFLSSAESAFIMHLLKLLLKHAFPNFHACALQA